MVGAVLGSNLLWQQEEINIGITGLVGSKRHQIIFPVMGMVCPKDCFYWKSDVYRADFCKYCV